MKNPIRVLTAVGALTALACTAMSMRNASKLPTVRALPGHSEPSNDRVSVLLPARDEAANIVGCMEAILAQDGVDEIIVFDDASTDATEALARTTANGDCRVQVHGDPTGDIPSGWLGKPWACERLASHATGDVLVFVDADVRLHEGAVAASVAMMRALHLEMLCPYPRQEATTMLTRIVQPMLQWSWLTFIPGEISMRRQLPSMAVGNGQFMVVDASAYRCVNGHAAVAGDVLEDVALAKTFRGAGLRTAVVSGSEVATCRMYDTDAELIDGYTKSLWTAFGNEPAALTTVSLLKLIYVLPPFMAVVSRDRRTRMWGMFGYAAATLGRVAVAQRTGQRTWPDALAAPLSVASLSALTALSLLRHRRGTLTWKGRSVG